jgi:hypothetical protein
VGTSREQNKARVGLGVRRFLQRLPLEFLACGALAGALACARGAVALDHRDANSSVMKFLHDLVRAARPAAPHAHPQVAGTAIASFLFILIN